MNEEIARAFVRILADTTRFGPEARAKIEAALRGIHPEVDVDADTGAAEAKLAALDVVINQIDGSDPEVDVHVDDHGTIAATTGRLTMLLALAAAVSPALVPIGAALTGALASGAAAAGAGIAGLGTVALGVSGVTGAVKALSAEHSRAGEAAERSAITQVNAASRIESAEASLANTRANAAYQAEQAQRRIADAVESERLAEIDLRRAREEARQELEDLQRQAEQGALAEKDAVLAVREAQFKLNETLSDRRKSELEKDRARLDYEEAKQRLEDLRADNQRLADEKAEADRKGVAGSDAVTEAQRRLADAQESVTEARRAAAEQERQAAFSISQAQRAVADAHQSAATAASSHAEAEDKVAKAMANLSPEARRFAHFIHDDLLPEFYDLRKTAQAGLLPGVQESIEDASSELPGLAHFVHAVATEMGGLAEEAADALDTPFWRGFFSYVDRNAVPTLDEMGQVTGNLAHGFAGLLEAFEPVERQMGAGLVRLTNRFAAFGENAGEDSDFQEFLRYIEVEGPRVVHTLGDIAEAGGSLAAALSVTGGPLLTVIDLIARLIDKNPELAAFVLQLWAWDKVLGSIGGKAIGAAKGLAVFTGAQAASTAASRAAPAALNPITAALAVLAVGVTTGVGYWQKYKDEQYAVAASARETEHTFEGRLRALVEENQKVDAATRSWNVFKVAGATAASGISFHQIVNLATQVDTLTRTLDTSADSVLLLSDAAGIDLTKSVDDATDVIENWIGDNIKADATGRRWASTTLLLSAYTNTAKDATQGFAAGLERLIGIQSDAIQTEDQLKLSLVTLKDRLADGSTALVGNGKAATTNRLAVESLVQEIKGNALKAFQDELAATNDVEAARRAGTKAVEKYVDQLRDELVQLGFNRKEVNKLIGELVDLDAVDARPTIKLAGYEAAERRLQRFHDHLFEITDHTWTATIVADLNGQDVGIGTPADGLEGLLLTPTTGTAGGQKRRASGGAVNAYTDYLVGERGAEIVRFNQPGYVYPADSPVTAAALGRSVGMDDARIVAALQELIRVVQAQTGVLVAQPLAMADGLNGTSRGARHRYRTTVR